MTHLLVKCDHSVGEYEFLRSSGLLVASGTGSTALLRSFRELSLERLEGICKHLGKKPNRAELEKILLDLNDETVFDPEADKLYYAHRELIDCFHHRKDGWADRVLFRAKSYKGVLCTDSVEHSIGYEDELEIRLCKPEQKLSTIMIQE